MISPPTGEATRDGVVDLLAIVRALRRHGQLAGADLSYELLRDVVAKSAGFVGASQMQHARRRGQEVDAVDPSLIVTALAAWGVLMTPEEARMCVGAGARG